jgi:hypothetical protein
MFRIFSKNRRAKVLEFLFQMNYLLKERRGGKEKTPNSIN